MGNWLSKIVLCLLLISSYGVSAQQKDALIARIESYNQAFPGEKLYLTFDKPYYAAGDTIWFKSILLNGSAEGPGLSEKIYVELYNDKNQIIEKKVTALKNGLGFGEFALRTAIQNGNYTIRAYTNWQQNFGADNFFHRSFYIGNAGQNTWLADSHQNIANGKVTINVQLRNIKNELAGFKDLDLTLQQGGKTISSKNLKTGADGTFTYNFPLPSEPGEHIELIATDRSNELRKIVVPVELSQENIDLQFMPEGGYLVNGINNKIAFKSIDGNGMGLNVGGKILNSRNEVQAEFTSVHKGMGSFYLYPQPQETYTAEYTVNGKTFRQKLETAKSEGTAIKIDHITKQDSVLIYIKATEKMRAENYELVAQNGGKISFAAKLDLRMGFCNLKISKIQFPDGIIHFTLFSPAGQPLNERQIFLKKELSVTLKIDQLTTNLSVRDSIGLEITATNEDGEPVMGAFSIAVTDNNMVRTNADENNIISHFLLKGNIKGNIEEPGWYFRDTETTTLQALDNLLLTQAWIGYKWDQLKQSAPPKYSLEKIGNIEGKITNILNSPVEGLKVSLLSLGKNPYIADTTSNQAGKFAFNDIPVTDTVKYLIKIKTAKGRSSTADIFVDEFKRSVLPLPDEKTEPWYLNPDPLFLKHYNDANKREELLLKERMLKYGTPIKAVDIIESNGRYKAPIRLFKHIQEEELKTIPRKSIRDLLFQRIDGFRIIADGAYTRFEIGRYPIIGMSVDQMGIPMDETGFLFDYINAEDVKDIKVFRGTNTASCKDCGPAFTYTLILTTRSGAGPYIKRPVGTYVYRPEPLSVSREFYSPKYAANSSAKPDLRSTIFWNANVTTDEYGKATISFFAGDQPGSYTIKLEGTDMQGRFGHVLDKILIKPGTSK